jgi:CheY-like chemotaxis protein
LLLNKHQNKHSKDFKDTCTSETLGMPTICQVIVPPDISISANSNKSFDSNLTDRTQEESNGLHIVNTNAGTEDSCINNDYGSSERNLAGSIPSDVDRIALKRVKYNFKGKTVLAVDDVSFNLSLIDIFFRNTGAQILFATNGSEAVELCITMSDISIVLMDIQMPVMNGLDATREIHKIYPAMPVIAITAFVHSDDKQRCFEAGCNGFLPKPCSREDLLRTVNYFFKI